MKTLGTVILFVVNGPFFLYYPLDKPKVILEVTLLRLLAMQHLDLSGVRNDFSSYFVLIFDWTIHECD